jgi:hypothetical protein
MKGLKLAQTLVVGLLALTSCTDLLDAYDLPYPRSYYVSFDINDKRYEASSHLRQMDYVYDELKTYLWEEDSIMLWINLKRPFYQGPSTACDDFEFPDFPDQWPGNTAELTLGEQHYTAISDSLNAVCTIRRRLPGEKGFFYDDWSFEFLTANAIGDTLWVRNGKLITLWGL